VGVLIDRDLARQVAWYRPSPESVRDDWTSRWTMESCIQVRMNVRGHWWTVYIDLRYRVAGLADVHQRLPTREDLSKSRPVGGVAVRTVAVR
jgi:hypothetical protein